MRSIQQPTGIVYLRSWENSYDSDGNTHGFVFTKGVFKKDVFTTIDVPGAKAQKKRRTQGLNGINVFGRLVELTLTLLEGLYAFVADKAALLKKGAFTTLDPPDTTRSQGGFINSLGQVVGTYRDVGLQHQKKSVVALSGSMANSLS